MNHRVPCHGEAVLPDILEGILDPWGTLRGNSYDVSVRGLLLAARQSQHSQEQSST